MSRREAILREVEEALRLKRGLDKKLPYDPSKMDCDQMPIGCWFWIFLVPAIVLFLILG